MCSRDRTAVVEIDKGNATCFVIDLQTSTNYTK